MDVIWSYTVLKLINNNEQKRAQNTEMNRKATEMGMSVAELYRGI